MATISFSITSALQLASTLTVSSLASAMLRVDASGVVSVTTLHSNLALATGTLGLATALTSINSVTSVAGQDLVLAVGTGGTGITITNSTRAVTFAAGISGTTATLSSLTDTRVVFASTAGLLAGAASFTFNSGTGALSATSFVGSGASLTSVVNSITGTGGQVTASAATGAVTLSLPSALTGINSVTSVAGQALVLATGTSSTALSFASATNIATFTAGVVGTSITLSSIGATQVVFGGAAGILTSDADMTFATDTLTVTKATIGGISHVANAITAANSITSNTATDLTLTGITGATVVLGNGTNGAVTITAAGAGNVVLASTTGTVTTARVFVSTNATDGTTGGAGGITTTGGIYAAKKIVSTTDLVAGGTIGAGGDSTASIGLWVRNTALTGTSQAGVQISPTFSSAATTYGRLLYMGITTAAAAFTMVNAAAIDIAAPTIGAASAITTLAGISIANMGTSGVTNAYGIDIAAQSGAATVNTGLRNAGLTVLTNVTEATTGGAGSLTTSGGLFATKAIVSASATDATTISTGSIITAGGVGITKALWVGGLANVAGVATFQSTLVASGIISNAGGIKRSTVQFDKTNGTLADVTGLSVALAASTAYRFRVRLSAALDATGGYKVAMAYSGSVTSSQHSILVYMSSSLYGASDTSTLTFSSAGGGGTSAFMDLEGIILTNAAGNLTVQFAQNSASGTSSVLINSFIEVMAL